MLFLYLLWTSGSPAGTSPAASTETQPGNRRVTRAPKARLQNANRLKVRLLRDLLADAGSEKHHPLPVPVANNSLHSNPLRFRNFVE